MDDPEVVADRKLNELAGRRGVYVSGPITTGLDLYNLLKRHGIKNKKELPNDQGSLLVQRNTARMKEFCRELGSRESSPIINPGETNIPGWTQDQYKALWTRVISLGISKIYFLDGWEYSNGAADEYCLGTELGLILVNERGEILAKDDAIRLLKAAREKLRSMGFPSDDIDRALQRLAR